MFETTNSKETKRVQDIITKIKEKDKENDNLSLFIIYTNYKCINDIEDANAIIEIDRGENCNKKVFGQFSLDSACLYNCNVVYSNCLENTTPFMLLFHHGCLVNFISNVEEITKGTIEDLISKSYG